MPFHGGAPVGGVRWLLWGLGPGSPVTRVLFSVTGQGTPRFKGASGLLVRARALDVESDRSVARDGGPSSGALRPCSVSAYLGGHTGRRSCRVSGSLSLYLPIYAYIHVSIRLPTCPPAHRDGGMEGDTAWSRVCALPLSPGLRLGPGHCPVSLQPSGGSACPVAVRLRCAALVLAEGSGVAPCPGVSPPHFLCFALLSFTAIACFQSNGL